MERPAWCEPRAAALAWLGMYLAITGVMLAAGQHWGLVATHVLLLLAIVPARSRRTRLSLTPLFGLIGDFLPLVAAPLLYTEIPALIGVAGTRYHDATVQRWELALFGTQPSHTLAARLPYLPLSELLHAGYLAYYLVIFLPALLLFVRGRRQGFAETVLVLTVTCTVCWAIFVSMPVQGPRYLFTAPTGVPDGPFRRLAVSLLAAGSSRGAAFPSSHMAVSVSMALVALRWQRAVGWTVSAVAILIGFGAVYGGFHYGVDIIAGALLGAATTALVIGTQPHR